MNRSRNKRKEKIEFKFKKSTKTETKPNDHSNYYVVHEKLTQVSIADSHVKKMPDIRTFTVLMLPIIAAEHGFINAQNISVKVGDEMFPGRLVLSKKLKSNIALLNENLPFKNADEDSTLTVFARCRNFYASRVSVTLSLGSDIHQREAFRSHLKDQLVRHRLAMKVGSHFTLQYLSRDFNLSVVEVEYFGREERKESFCCLPQTLVEISENRSKAASYVDRITFDDVGGCELAVQQILQEVETFFHPPESGKTRQHKGILISGPSGCGKSLLLDALAQSYENKCMSVKPHELRSGYRGETELNLKRLFQKAVARSPCIVCIDDLDILCGDGSKGGHRGAVTSLLHFLDGMDAKNSEGVLVISATAVPLSLDAALRRPGRLSVDIVLSAPDEVARGKIFGKMLQGVPSVMTEDEVGDLVSLTPGYVGGDLRNLLLEARIKAEEAPLSLTHVKSALTVVKPSSLKSSGYLEQNIQMSDIAGYTSLKSCIYDSMNLSLKKKLVFTQCGLPTPSRFLLFGPPGCGKSILAKALASEFHLNIISVNRSSVLGKYFGESERNLAEIFKQASDCAPCILLFENFEGLCGRKRNVDSGTDVECRVINFIKVALDGITRNDDIFIIAETNRPELLDKDVIRPGRFHEYYFVNLPSSDDRKLLIQMKLPNEFITEEITMQTLIDAMDGFTVSEVIQFCDELKETSEDTTVSLLELINNIWETTVPNTSVKAMKKYDLFSQDFELFNSIKLKLHNMPPRKEVEALEQKCFSIVAAFIHREAVEIEENPSTCLMQPADLSSMIRSLPFVINEIIITRVIETIHQTVRRNRHAVGIRTCLHVLLQAQVQRLNLNGLFFDMRLPAAVNMAIREVVMDRVALMTNLTSFHMVSNCNDNILRVVAERCPELRDVTISISDLVSDEGLIALVKGCPEMESLRIYKCWKLTVHGVQAVLKYGSSLRELQCDQLGFALVSGFMQSAGRTSFRLTSFEQTQSLFEPSIDEMKWLGHVCPNLESVRLFMEDEKLSLISYLGLVKIVSIESSNLGFGFQTAIKSLSMSLTTIQLSCESMTKLHLTQLGLCPQLKTLQIVTTAMEGDSQLINTGSYFPVLTSLHLEIWRESSAVVKECIEFFILWCRSLVSLTVKADMLFFNDSYLIHMLSLNPLSNVTTFILASDKFVPLTVASVHLLMSSCQSLETLGISSWNVSEEEYFQIRKYVADNNYNFNVT